MIKDLESDADIDKYTFRNILTKFVNDHHIIQFLIHIRVIIEFRHRKWMKEEISNKYYYREKFLSWLMPTQIFSKKSPLQTSRSILRITYLFPLSRPVNV